MKSFKKEHLESKIQQVLSDFIINELDEDVAKETIINQVILNEAKTVADIYFSFSNNETLHLQKLTKLMPLLRTEVAKSLDIKYAPELRFLIDDSLEKVNTIAELIADEQDN